MFHYLFLEKCSNNLCIFYLCWRDSSIQGKRNLHTMPASFFWQKIHSPSQFPVLSWAGRAHYNVICINPAFTKTVDRTDKPKIPSKFAIRTAQYNVTQPFKCWGHLIEEIRYFYCMYSGLDYLCWSTIPFLEYHSLDPDFQWCSKYLLVTTVMQCV